MRHPPSRSRRPHDRYFDIAGWKVRRQFDSTYIHKRRHDMSWKEQINKAIEKVKSAADSETAHALASKAKTTAHNIARKAKESALDAADAFVQANSDPAAIKLRFMHADLSIVAPSDDIQITRPSAATLVIADGAGNGLVINAAAEEPFVVDTIGTVTRLDDVTYDLGPEDGINLVVLKA
jgi:hypothetical protein